MAARPHGSSAGSREWSMGPNEPFWRTNTSFSPPLSRRWDYQTVSEGLDYESSDDDVVALDESSLSSNSKENRSWVDSEHVPDHGFSASDGAFSYFNSPSDSYHNRRLMPPPVQGVNINEYVRDSLYAPQKFSRLAEGTLRVPESVGSLSSRSDDSGNEHGSKTHASSHRSFSSCCSFMSKPIHPFSFAEYTGEEESSYVSVGPSNSSNRMNPDKRLTRAFSEFPSPGSLNLGSTPRREASRWSGTSTVDFTDVPGPLEPECFGLPRKNLYGGSKCGLCDRLLSQGSPWGSRRMVWSGDMPITGVLSCWHVFHAECLERWTPKPQKHDPPCPVCEKSDNDYGIEQWAISRLKNGLPKLRSLGEEGPSRVWSCGQGGDCVEGAIDVPKHSSSMLLRNRSRLKRQLSLKGNLGKERAENSKRSGLCSPRVSLGAIGCSNLTQSPVLKRW